MIGHHVQMTVSFHTVMVLMTVMAVKHFCADFLCQTAAIARGKAAPDHWLVPLLIHAGGHAAITLAIALLFFPTAWWLAPVELVLHAGIDRGKVIAGKTLGLEPTRSSFWWLFGFDQMLHQLTNVVIVGVFLLHPISA